MAAPLSSDRYIRNSRSGEGSTLWEDSAGIAQRAGLPQSRRYWQTSGDDVDFGVTPITPAADETFGTTGAELLYDKQFERAAAGFEMAGRGLSAVGEVRGAEIRRQAAEAAAKARTKGGILGGIMKVAGAALPFLCDARCKWDMAPWRSQSVEVRDELSELAEAVRWIRDHA